MKRLAVDVVLIPPTRIMEEAIAINQNLIRHNPAEIILNRTACIPHVSLLMGSISSQDMDATKEILEEISREHAAILLEVIDILVKSDKPGKVVSSFDLVPSPALQQLHETVVDRLGPLLSSQARSEDMYRVSGEQISPSSLRWINEYQQVHSYGNFWPHITLGYGKLREKQDIPIAQKANRLALCHLGNHCTCRSIIKEVELGRLKK